MRCVKPPLPYWRTDAQAQARLVADVGMALALIGGATTDEAWKAYQEAYDEYEAAWDALEEGTEREFVGHGRGLSA